MVSSVKRTRRVSNKKVLNPYAKRDALDEHGYAKKVRNALEKHVQGGPPNMLRWSTKRLKKEGEINRNAVKKCLDYLDGSPWEGKPGLQYWCKGELAASDFKVQLGLDPELLKKLRKKDLILIFKKELGGTVAGRKKMPVDIIRRKIHQYFSKYMDTGELYDLDTIDID